MQKSGAKTSEEEKIKLPFFVPEKDGGQLILRLYSHIKKG